MDADFGRLGRRIRSEREKQGMTQQELARRLGMSQAWLSHVEKTGRHVAEGGYLPKFAEVLGLDPEQLLWDILEQDDVLAALRNQPLLDDEAREALIVLYRRSLETRAG